MSNEQSDLGRVLEILHEAEKRRVDEALELLRSRDSVSIGQVIEIARMRIPASAAQRDRWIDEVAPVLIERLAGIVERGLNDD